MPKNALNKAKNADNVFCFIFPYTDIALASKKLIHSPNFLFLKNLGTFTGCD
ncbi:hypothetical protein KJ590_02430 [Patescibacteria group bacterium]|nr:hypothetical protein [Patescibacteria group bacterium]MBU4142836.1 hypothetical protein [Patescibacteria group bacterium]